MLTVTGSKGVETRKSRSRKIFPGDVCGAVTGAGITLRYKLII